MSWPLDDVKAWVKTALSNMGYSEELASAGSWSVGWLQERDAPGVAAIAQHIDFLSAYQLRAKQSNDDASCPIRVGLGVQQRALQAPQTFCSVRQPLLLLPFLAETPSTASWKDVNLAFSHDGISIEYERKVLRTILVSKADVSWAYHPAETGTSTSQPMNEVRSRELVYIKTIQHYAGNLKRKAQESAAHKPEDTPPNP